MALAACVLAGTGMVAADTATTEPRGVYVVKVPGKPAGLSQGRTHFGIQLLSDRLYAGLVSGVTGNRVAVSGTDPSFLSSLARDAYLQVITGSGSGFITDVTGFSSAGILCAADPGPWISPGTQIRIRNHHHLGDLFGAANSFGLASGVDAASADNVVAWDPQTQGERVYYFNSTRSRWEEKDVAADAAGAVLRFPYGLYILRRSTGPLRILLSGEAIGSDALLLPVRTGGNIFSLPINLTASLDAYFPSSGAFPVISATNAREADLLVFEEPFTGNRRGPFYRSSRAGAQGWREIGGGAAGGSLDLLSTLIIRRTGPPGYVRVQGSMAPGANPPPVPVGAEPGELPLEADLPMPGGFAPGLTYQVQISNDLQTWNAATQITVTSSANNRVRFRLPSGQSRAFYRLKVEMPF